MDYGYIAGHLALWLFVGTILYLYGLNFYKAVKSVKGSDFSIRTFLRLGGVFFPILGIFMGIVK